MPLVRFCCLALLGLILSTGSLLAHCQVPCGIYDDAARIAQIREDITTIEKATHKIAALAGQSDAESQNQLVRWINTKEEHASHIIEIVSEYFLTQKIKPGKGKTVPPPAAKAKATPPPTKGKAAPAKDKAKSPPTTRTKKARHR